MNRYRLSGFTLIELLVVIAILSILATLGVTNFQTARIKARDVSRKSDLQTIAKSLETYVNDYQSYPVGLNGQIVCQPPSTTCNYGSSFQDSKSTIYAVKIPTDPLTYQVYYYTSTGTKYILYAHLENALDPSIITITPTVYCGNNIKCNYKLNSPNQL
ncbi:MAG: type II secretion system protein [bacterium]